jgi:hypothetical protein
MHLANSVPTEQDCGSREGSGAETSLVALLSATLEGTRTIQQPG